MLNISFFRTLSISKNLGPVAFISVSFHCLLMQALIHQIHGSLNYFSAVRMLYSHVVFVSRWEVVFTCWGPFWFTI